MWLLVLIMISLIGVLIMTLVRNGQIIKVPVSPLDVDLDAFQARIDVLVVKTKYEK